MKCSFGNDRIVKNVSNVLILIHEKAMMKPLRFESRWPENNFSDVIDKELDNQAYDCLLMSATSCRHIQ